MALHDYFAGTWKMHLQLLVYTVLVLSYSLCHLCAEHLGVVTNHHRLSHVAPWLTARPEQIS